MAVGKSGYVTASGKTTGGGLFELRLGWSETYELLTNKSVVTLTSCEARHEYGGVYYPSGSLTVDGTTVITMDGTGASHRFDTVYGGKEWAAIRSWKTQGKIPPWVSGEIVHNNDGTKTATIGIKLSFWRSEQDTCNIDTTVSIELTTIPRASEITSAADVTLGNKCSVKWTPKAAAFRYKLKFSLGDWSYTSSTIWPNKTTEYTHSAYTIPLEVAKQIPNARIGSMKVELYTYSDSGATVLVGNADSETFAVTVPDNDSTRPAVSMTLTPVSSLAAKFAGLHIQGKTKVQAALTAEGKLDATIKSYSMKVAGTTYDSDDSYTSGYLTSSGKETVYGYANDSRGITGSVSQEIAVISYQGPKILAAAGEDGVVAARCDETGELNDAGTYLKIKAKRSYSPVVADGVQKNFCKIQYRYKLENAASYSSWTTILAGDAAGDEIVTGALLGGVLSNESSYVVQVQAIDDIGESATTTVHVMTETVYWHRTRNGLGLGKYVEGENLLDVAWDTHLRGEVRIGTSGMTLKEYILAVISEGG